MWALWNDALSVYFLLFFILLGCFCVFFPLPISTFCLGLHLFSSSYSNKTQLLPFCQSWGWCLFFICFAWSFIGKRSFIYLIYWKGVFVTLVGILQWQCIFFLKKLTLFTNVIFQLNFNITKVFSVAKQNLFDTSCYITFEIVPFWPWEKRGCVVGVTPAGVKGEQRFSLLRPVR